jgi:hypothetical protein
VCVCVSLLCVAACVWHRIKGDIYIGMSLTYMAVSSHQAEAKSEMRGARRLLCCMCAVGCCLSLAHACVSRADRGEKKGGHGIVECTDSHWGGLSSLFQKEKGRAGAWMVVQR